MDDIDKYEVSRLQQAVRAEVRVGVRAISGSDLDIVDVLRTVLVHHGGGGGLEVVFFHARLDRFGDGVVGGIGNRGGVFEDSDFVFVLDGARVLHHGLAVRQLKARVLQREDDLRFGGVDAEPAGGVEAVGVENHVEIAEKGLVAFPLHGESAEHGAVSGIGALFEPGAVQLLGQHFRTEAEDVRLPASGDNGVARHVVYRRVGYGRGRRVPLVAGFEQQQAIDVVGVHVGLDAIDPVAAHAVEIDPFFVIDLHHALGAVTDVEIGVGHGGWLLVDCRWCMCRCG